jgi:hypothetical protein
MKQSKLVKAVLSIALIISFSDLFASDDRMCKELLEFANETNVDVANKVVLVIDGGTWKSACVHQKRAPEKRFCRWLSNNTSYEFMSVNVSRAIACLSADKNSTRNIDFERDAGKLIARDIDAYPVNAVVELEYSYGQKGEQDTLSIKAFRGN